MSNLLRVASFASHACAPSLSPTGCRPGSHEVIVIDKKAPHTIDSLTPGGTPGGDALLSALAELQFSETAPERELENVARVAATLCATPFAVMSMEGFTPRWFRSRPAVEFDELGRGDAFFAAVAAEPAGVFECDDLSADERFAGHPLVAGHPHLRSFAGVPLVVDGRSLGTICVFDTAPRRLPAESREGLRLHMIGVVTVLRHRRAARALVEAEARRAAVENDLTIFSAAIANANDAILIFTKRTGRRGWPVVTFANAAWGRLIGRDPATSIGRTPAATAALDGNAHIFRGISDTEAGERPVSGTIFLRRDDGTEVEAEMTIAALPRTSDARHWVTVMRDLSDRKSRERAEREADVARHERSALEASESRLRELFVRTPAIIFTLDPELRFRSSLGGGLRAVGLEQDELVGTDWMALMDAPVEKAARDAARRALRGESATFEHAFRGRILQVFLEPLRGPTSGAIEGLAGIVFDMTDHVASLKALAATEANLARTERAAKVGTWLHDLQTDRRTNSEELHRIFGVGEGREGLDHFLSIIVAEDRDRVRLALRDAYETAAPAAFEYRIDASGVPRWVRETLEFSFDADRHVTRVDGIVVDITERRAAELEAARLAGTDDITGLPNRATLASRIGEQAAGARAAGCGTLILVDLDRFHATNAAFGHTIGDRLLRTAAERIVACVPYGFVARLEGDTFAVLVAPSLDAGDLAATVHEAFRQPFQVNRYRLFATVSIGIATHEAGEGAETFLRRADVAMSAAKAEGGNRTVAFDDDIALKHRRRIGLDLDLRGAVDRREFHLAYQPIVDARGDIARVEALLRWIHPVEGSIPPSEFVAIAEANGEIVPIGRWVLRAACSQLRYLRAATGSHVRVAVNVSARQFADPELLPAIEDALAASGLDPGALELEITESTIASDPVRAAQLLGELRAAGVTISIDDFGTGFSSLASLQRLPIDTLKIDRSFIAGTPHDRDACAIVEAILGLARQLSLETVAEGVETAEQAAFLRTRGCTMLQGYYFARPAVPAELVASIALHRLEQNA